MTEPIHDDEPDTGEAVVRALLRSELPQWANRPIEYLRNSGTDNAMWRVRLEQASDVVIRLPRRSEAAEGVLHEVSILEQLGGSATRAGFRTPTVRHVGAPHECFAHHWSVLDWIDGSDAWTARDEIEGGGAKRLGTDLAEAVVAIGRLEIDGARPRRVGSRGGPLGPLLERLDGWLTSPEWNAAALIDVAAARRLAAEAAELVDEPVEQYFVHGDLIPGNLLVERGRLTAVIDWGGAGHGDRAQDLAPAWAVLTGTERAAFRDAVVVSDATWIRGRTFELEHAVGGVLYYGPRGHPLGDVMARTLERIIDAR
ncbi:MAG: phosphotransferase [Ilumatobacter sp.]